MSTQPPRPPVLLEPTDDGDTTRLLEALIAAARDIVERQRVVELPAAQQEQDKAA